MASALEAAIADLVLGPELESHDSAAVAAFFSHHGLDDDDRDAIIDAGIERLLVYRRLVRQSLWQALALSIPRTMARLGTSFDGYFARFLAERAPRTHYLRDVTRELLDFCAALWAEDPHVPAYIPELARHEALRIEIAALEAKPPGQKPGPLELDRGVQFIEAARIALYEHAVHELSEDENDRSPAARRETALFVYRSPEHQVRYLELTPLAAGILGQLFAGATLREAVERACRERGMALDDSVIAGSARVLSDLADRGALLGATISDYDPAEARVS